ncbi:hypothetical protein SEUBUCD646_0G03060 [Saccharomyces eubayanus]|uniref:C2H2-type domain-containing protein n=2 Tax=Saccharomyces TaxID=4930 RepID=A0A6C1E7I7_SACPS|nr:hypothetical protein GRS66_007668 [Saccharomyces pastorianus]CAI2002574.1 hypothetical protein SEUBUCD650_0G03040 [Saccharomyces eubayanus]CAI2022215.1 hypothetical protein SEUBUCD646_0G03060 [Saccharomyces eubayanus]
MPLYFGQNSAIANVSWNGENFQEVKSFCHWHEAERNINQNSVTLLGDDANLYFAKNYLLGSLESTVPIPEVQGQVEQIDTFFETNDSQLYDKYGEMTNNIQYITPSFGPVFKDPVKIKPQKEADSAFFEGNATEQIASQCSPPAYSQLSHVAQLYNDPRVSGTLSQKQTKRGSYRCSHCSDNFPTILMFAAHLDKFNLRRPYTCPIKQCPWKILGFLQATGLRRHCASQHRGELDVEMEKSLNLRVEKYPGLSCPFSICQKTFKRKDAYKRHVAMVHNNADSRFNKRLKKIMNSISNNKSK